MPPRPPHPAPPLAALTDGARRYRYERESRLRAWWRGHRERWATVRITEEYREASGEAGEWVTLSRTPVHATAQEGPFSAAGEPWILRSGSHVTLGWSRPLHRDALEPPERRLALRLLAGDPAAVAAALGALLDRPTHPVGHQGTPARTDATLRLVVAGMTLAQWRAVGPELRARLLAHADRDVRLATARHLGTG